MEDSPLHHGCDASLFHLWPVKDVFSQNLDGEEVTESSKQSDEKVSVLDFGLRHLGDRDTWTEVLLLF